MTAVGDGDLPAQGHFRTAVAPLHCHGGQRAQRVCFRNSSGGELDSGSLLGQMFPHLGKDLVFQSREPIFCSENLGFQIL